MSRSSFGEACLLQKLGVHQSLGCTGLLGQDLPHVFEPHGLGNQTGGRLLLPLEILLRCGRPFCCTSKCQVPTSQLISLGTTLPSPPTRKTGGRPSGGRALLCRQAQPLQRMEQGAHWELGRWAHHLLPLGGGLHVFNVYGYSSDKERAPELNREVFMEIFAAVAAVAALGNRQIFILGDWNFVPDNFPIDLVHGGTLG
eukprot:3076594-Amphidinium_carterae.4